MRKTPTDCGDIPLWPLRAWRLIFAAACLSVFATFSPAQAQSLGGFTAPLPKTSPTRAAKPQTQANAPQIVAVHIAGIAEDNSGMLAKSLRSRVGQLPAQHLVDDDVATLLASGRFESVTPQWSRIASGWILTYKVTPAPVPEADVADLTWEPEGSGWTTWLGPRSESPQVTIRAQSEDFPEEDDTPRPRSSLGNKAPMLPRAPEDFEQPGVSKANQLLDEPLADVRIEGNVTIPVSEVQKHVKTRPGRVATQAMIKDDVDALVRTRWFVSVEPVISRSESGVVLTYRILERPIVRNVEYRGLKKMKQAKLEALTNLKIGSPYDVSANRECARRIEEMYHEKGFAFATVELEKGNHPDDREVVFLIEEGPKVSVVHVEFEGNQFFSDALLDLKLQTKKRILWSFGGKYDPATIPNDKASVMSYYRGLGFFDMTIDHELKFNADRSQVTIVYNVAEGVRYRVRNVEIIGNDVIPVEQLKADQTIESGEFYTERKLAADVDKMREKYGALGRLFAKIEPVQRFTEEPGVIDILYRIDEDKVYRVREFNVHIAGDHPHTRTNLVRNIALIKPGDLADPRKIQASKRRLGGSGYFEGNGDLAPRLEISRVEDPGWLQIPSTELARGQNAAYAQAPAGTAWTAPKGANSAPPAVPKSAAPLTPAVFTPAPSAPATKRPRTSSDDDLLTPLVPAMFTNEPVDGPLTSTAPVIRGQDQLLAQGRGPDPLPQRYIYDQSPQGDPLAPGINDPYPLWDPRIPPPEFIDIDAYLAEARTGRLMFGAGVNSNSGVVGNIVLSENNFDILRPPTSFEDIWNGTAWRGAGQKFRIEALPGSEVSRYLVDWQDPYFLDTNINLGVSGFYFTRFYRYWDEQRVGGRVRLGKQFTQTWSGSVALRGEQVHIADIPTGSPQSLVDVLGDSFLSTAQFSLIHDTRDAAFLPTAGHYVEFSVEQAFAEYNYSRLEIDGRQYFTTYQRPDGGGKHVVNLHGNFGYTTSDTPIFEKFYAGGFQSFRGFAFRGVTPLENGVEVGGQFLLLGSVEYQVPILANEMVKVVAFSDFGTVDEDVTFDNFRVAVGGGLRIQVPGMGPVPVALDWAVPVVKSDFDREQLFSFYIGINR